MSKMQKPTIKTRVPVTILPSETAQQEVELDYRVLLLGDYSKSDPDNHKGGNLKSRKPEVIASRGDLKKVMGRIKPALNISVPNKLVPKSKEEEGSEAVESQFDIDLEFKTMKDFHPDQIAQKVTPIRKLLAERERLKAVKNMVLKNAKFKAKLEKNLASSSKEEFIKGLMDNLSVADEDESNNDQTQEG